MPPKSHSSSSHSSSGRSYSGSRSSGSRSYSSSGFSRSPSPHSSSSHSSYSSSVYSAPARTKTVPNRPRKNQPSGFTPGQGARPAYHYARRHDYVFYPIAWTDSSTGTSYQAGYYDEDGNRYDSVAFKNGDSYDNVVCHCPYCEQDTILNLTSEQVASQSLQCPHCGGRMEIRSALDEETGKAVTAAQNAEVTAEKKKNKTLRWVIAVLALMLSFRMCTAEEKSPVQPEVLNNNTNVVQNNAAPTNPEVFGAVINLARQSDGSYAVISNSSAGSDKSLIWDADAESYYDAETECWLWYNNEVSPPIWQYWYEGISSDYGDYGWMEYDAAEQSWYIESSGNNWIKLPAKYDTAGLWHISS